MLVRCCNQDTRKIRARCIPRAGARTLESNQSELKPVRTFIRRRSMKTKKIGMFCLCAAAFALALVGGCDKGSSNSTTVTTAPSATGGGGGTSGPITIGFIVKQPEEPWFQLEWKFAEQAAKDDGFNLIQSGATDGEKVLGAIDTLSSSGAQGFVICAPDVKLGPAIVSKAKMRGIKVLAVDDQFIGNDGKPMTDVPYLGISARKIGQSVGQALMDEMKKRN